MYPFYYLLLRLTRQVAKVLIAATKEEELYKKRRYYTYTGSSSFFGLIRTFHSWKVGSSTCPVSMSGGLAWKTASFKDWRNGLPAAF
jgi:hypothetical protein